MDNNIRIVFQAISVLFFLLQLPNHVAFNSNNEQWLTTTEPEPPIPTPWPEQFHALLYMNLTSTHLQLSDLWYDWPKGRNVNIFQKQLGILLYDIEWNNGTSFYYTLGADAQCQMVDFGVGIPRPDFLDGAQYLGRVVTDGFLCDVWEKVDFIWYYEDVVTKTPVRWDFYDGISSHVMTFEIGAVLPDSVVQAPAYCFTEPGDKKAFSTWANHVDLGFRSFSVAVVMDLVVSVAVVCSSFKVPSMMVAQTELWSLLVRVCGDDGSIFWFLTGEIDIGSVLEQKTCLAKVVGSVVSEAGSVAALLVEYFWARRAKITRVDIVFPPKWSTSR